LWDLALETLRNDWTFMGAYQLAGAKHTFATAWLKSDRMVQLNLNRWKVPKEAEILQEHYSTVGPADGPPVVPLRWEPNTNMPRHLRMIYGATYGRKAPPKIHLNISLSWIAPGPDEVSIHQLADAVNQYAGGRYDALTVPANVAVEAALVPVIRDWGTAFCPAKDWKIIGSRYAQSTVLALVAADTLRMPRLEAGIVKLLDDLRDRRNSMGHTGKPPPNKALSKAHAGELLAAAIFGCHYARFLGTAVTRLRRRKGLPPRTP
jgi:hypothetical protein